MSLTQLRPRRIQFEPFEWLPSSMDIQQRLPAMDVVESNEDVQVHVEVPGMDKKDIKVEFDDGVLTISGERKSESETTTDNQWTVKERLYGKFTRSVTLPKGVQADHITASCDNGVLCVKVPKGSAPSTKAIDIQ